jgi:exonuclease SbcC
MRLNRLDIVGFGAFREPTAFDFSDTDFFALVGPTGSGKSTVIDAVCFALYGCVPRYEDQRLNRYVITLGASEARVSLDFELNGYRYLATRVVRRSAKGQVSTKEARLERVENDGTPTTLAGAEREMNQAIEALLHLSFKHFTRCVVLPQGEFAEFLRAKGEDRRDLLIRLLNFDIYQRVGQRAGKVAESAMTEIALHRQQLESLASATPEALKRAKETAKALKKLASDTEKARPKIDEETRLAAAQDQAASEADRLAALLGKIAVPADVRRHGEDQKQAEAGLKVARDALAAVRTTREAAEEATKGLPAVTELAAANTAHERLAVVVPELHEAKSRFQDAEQKDEAARVAVEDGERKLTAAAAELDRVRVALQAADLAQTLAVGEPCPVCLQVVRVIPDHKVPKELSKAQAAEKKAKDTLAKLRNAHRGASATLATCKTKVQGLEAEQRRLLEQIKAYPDFEALKALRTDVEAKHAALELARKDEDEKGKRCEKAQEKLDKLISQVTAFQAAYSAQRDGVASLGPPAAGKGSLLVDWETLVAWAGPAKTGQEQAAQAAKANALEHRHSAADAVQGFIERAGELEVYAKGDIVVVLTAVTAASVKAAGTVGDIEAAIEKRKELEDQIKEAAERSEVAGTLRTHLRADHFPEWLISEALELLVADASKTLRALTNDTFSLTLGEREFMVVDHANADEQRSARTLSGGETFQASLALALALSDQIRGLAAEGAPQLDALFLDEGFGTLDAETLDTVASTIENLGQSGRMVGIISHVRELAGRVPVRFEIQKSARTASVEKVYA